MSRRMGLKIENIKGVRRINSIEEFYEEKKEYNLLDDFLHNKSLFFVKRVEGKDGLAKIELEMNEEICNVVSEDNIDNITVQIEKYIDRKVREIEDYILNKAREKLDEKREVIVRDLKIKDFIKGEK